MLANSTTEFPFVFDVLAPLSLYLQTVVLSSLKLLAAIQDDAALNLCSHLFVS